MGFDEDAEDGDNFDDADDAQHLRGREERERREERGEERENTRSRGRERARAARPPSTLESTATRCYLSSSVMCVSWSAGETRPASRTGVRMSVYVVSVSCARCAASL